MIENIDTIVLLSQHFIRSYTIISPKVLENKRAIMALSKKNGDRYFGKKFADDEEVVREFISNGAMIFDKISPRLQQRRDIVLLAIKNDIINKTNVPNCLKNDHEIMRIFNHVNPNEDEILKILTNDNLEPHIYRDIIFDKVLFLRCVSKIEEESNAFVPSCFDDDIDVIKEIVRINYMCFQTLSPKMRKNDEIIAIYVDNGGDQLSILPEKYYDDYDVVAKMVKRYPKNYKFASERLRNDIRIVNLLPICRESFSYIPQKMFDDYNLVAKFATYYYLIPYNLCEDINFVKTALHYNGRSIRKFPKFRGDYEMANIAINSDARAYKHLSKKLKKNSKIVQFMTQVAPCEVWMYEYFYHNRDFALRFIEKFIDGSGRIANKHSADYDIVLKLLSNNRISAQKIDDKLVTNHKFLRDCVINHVDECEFPAIKCILDDDKIMIELIKKDITLFIEYRCCIRLQNNSEIIAHHHKIPFAISQWASINRAIICAKDDTLCEIICDNY